MSNPNSTPKGVVSELRVLSIGACIAMPQEKKKQPGVVIAYQTQDAEYPAFVMTPLSNKKQLHTRESLFDAIMQAEGVRHITYVDPIGQPKDIFFCRAASGTVTDVIERDYEGGTYADGFAEIYEGNIKFRVDREIDKLPYYEKVNLTVSAASNHTHAPGSYDYAMVNAYNACLLGRIFDREELRLETRDHRRVRVQVCLGESAYINSSTLYIHPVFDDTGVCVDHYASERFQYIDGLNLSTRSYRIKYSNRFRAYDLSRSND